MRNKEKIATATPRRNITFNRSLHTRMAQDVAIKGIKEKKKFNITTGFALCWVAHLIFQGAAFGKRKPTTRQLYRKDAYGVNIPLLCNVMTRDVFVFMHCHIHFCDNDMQKKQDNEGYNPLFKVIYVLKVVGKGIRRA